MRNVSERVAKIKQAVLENDHEVAYERTMRLLYDLARRLEVGSIDDVEQVAESILDAIHFQDLKDF